jgi:hypothetical protein
MLIHCPRLLGPSISLLVLAAVVPAPVGQDEAPPITPQDLVGEWAFFEDRSPPTSPRGLRPNQGRHFVGKLAGEVLELEQHRPGDLIERVFIALDGSSTEQEVGDRLWTTAGQFEEGVLHTELTIEPLDPDGKGSPSVYTYTYTRTANELSVHMQMLEPYQLESVSVYRRPEDIPRLVQASATIDQLAWLPGAWTGTLGKSSIEERWSPIDGGAMLATSRTVSGGRMVAFEYLRIVERDGGLVYVAQPNGRPPTEFGLTEIEEGRARFENASHDFPQRIEYELNGEEGLRATISDLAGGRAQTFEFKREAR